MQARDRLAERRGGVPIDCGPGEGWQISEAGCTIKRRNFGGNAPVIRNYSGEARGIGDRTRERAERIERFAKDIDAIEWNRAIRRLESDDTAVRRRTDDRAVGLRADCTADMARRDRGRRPGGGAAGRVRNVPWIARLAGMHEGEFSRYRLAEDVAADGDQTRDADGFSFGYLSRKDRRSHLRRQLARRNDVFDADVDAGQQAGWTGSIATIGFGARAGAIECRPCIDLRVGCVDARELRFGQRPRREPSLSERGHRNSKRQRVRRNVNHFFLSVQSRSLRNG